jgi:hypothetical protein
MSAKADDWKLPWSASCLCGQVRMRVTKAPVVSAACHCDGCQKLSSSAFSMTLMLPADGFEVLSGDTEIGALHRAEIQHHFCTHCKSWLYTTGPLLGGHVNFRPTMLDNASWVRPYMETWAAAKLPGVSTGAAVSYDQFPPPEDFQKLMDGYARDGTRP